MMENIILVGYGGHGKSMADSIERGKKYRIVGYTDLKKHNCCFQYLGTDEVLKELYGQGVRNAAISIGFLGKGNIREQLYDKLLQIGYYLPVIKDPSAIISDTAKIGEGTFIGKGAIVNAEARIGKNVIINTKALVEHQCIVDDFAHIAVGAVLCGQVCVGKRAFIGANATIIQGRTVKMGQIVPAGETIR